MPIARTKIPFILPIGKIRALTLPTPALQILPSLLAILFVRNECIAKDERNNTTKRYRQQ